MSQVARTSYSVEQNTAAKAPFPVCRDSKTPVDWAPEQLAGEAEGCWPKENADRSMLTEEVCLQATALGGN